jgi:hypothetical protein
MAEDDNAVTAISWERVAKRLELHAFRIAGLEMRTDADGPTDYTIGASVGPQDLASKVIKEFLMGKIEPDPAKPLTESYLTNLLKAALKKDFYDLLKSRAVRKTAYAEEVAIATTEGEEAEDFFDSHDVKKVPTYKRHRMLSDALPAPDHFTRYQADLKTIYEQVKNDEAMEEMIRAICERDLRWPQELATYLKTSPEDINNRQKRLRRRFKHLRPPRQRQKKAI